MSDPNSTGSSILWVQSHWTEIMAVLALGWTCLIGIASIIVKWTPTLKDDNALLWLIKLASKVALNRNVDDNAVRAAKNGQ